MHLSYWEYKTWLHHIDFTVVGSGIVGLSTALSLREKYPKARILVLERGILPQGASSKNAGFACFGSISEILSDLDDNSEEAVFQLVKRRFEGIRLLKSVLGEDTIDFVRQGGHEIFLNKDLGLFEKCHDAMAAVNQLLRPIFNKDAFVLTDNKFGFKEVHDQYITHVEEGQLDTGKMMHGLLQKAYGEGIKILNSVEVETFHDHETSVLVKTNRFEFETNKLLVCTNGFASKLLKREVSPARAQVLVTKPIKNLKIKGTFHFDQGYYYFRNIDNRILFGGGRNLDFASEQTTEFGHTEKIQKELERLLNETILPNKEIEIDRRWSGIMGVGSRKDPIVEQLSNNVFCGVRLGGMGVAIGSLIGKELVALL